MCKDRTKMQLDFHARLFMNETLQMSLKLIDLQQRKITNVLKHEMV